MICGSDPYSCRLRGCSSTPKLIIRSVLALPWTTGVAMTISLTYDQPGREPPAQFAERRVRDARHRGEHHRRRQRVGADRERHRRIHGTESTLRADPGLTRPENAPIRTPDVRNGAQTAVCRPPRRNVHRIVRSTPDSGASRSAGGAGQAVKVRRRLGVAPTSSGVGPSVREAVPAGGGDHRRVVGAHRPARQEPLDPVLLAGVEDLFAQQRVGRDAAAEDDARWRRPTPPHDAPW